MSNCLFCKIVAKEIPAQIVHENDHVVASRIHVVGLTRVRIGCDSGDFHVVHVVDDGVLGDQARAAEPLLRPLAPGAAALVTDRLALPDVADAALVFVDRTRDRHAR